MPEDGGSLVDRIAQLVGEGHTAAEIGAVLNIPEQRVRRLAARSSLRLQEPGTARHIGTTVTRQRYQILRDLAAGAQVECSTMASRIIDCALADGLEITTRKLGSLALPKRVYRRRGEG